MGLTLVDEGGLTLRQITAPKRQRLAQRRLGDSHFPLKFFMDFITNNSSVFRLLFLQERRRHVERVSFSDLAREIEHFKSELADYLAHRAPVAK